LHLKQQAFSGRKEVKSMTKRLMKIAGALIAGASLILLIIGLIWAVGTNVGVNISNGGDSGSDNAVNAAGDLVVSTTELGAQGVSSTAAATVTQGYDLGDLSAPADSTVALGGNKTYDYTVKNLSNGTDTIKVTVVGSSATATGAATSTWGIEILDSGGVTKASGAGNTNVSFSFTSVSSNTSLQFKVKIIAPGSPTGSDGNSYAVTTRAESNNGTADAWDASSSTITANPFSGGFTQRGDSLDDSTTSTITATVMYAKLEVSGSTSPGSQLTYTIKYDNDGSGTASGLVIQNAIPSNTTYVQSSATGSNSPHTGATATANVNIGTLASPNYQADGTAGTVVAVRWIFSGANVAAHNGDAGDDTTGVNGTIPDVDAGQVTYKVTIN
jgi:uncharacterized repeat protein (TIGR01451 family)